MVKRKSTTPAFHLVKRRRRQQQQYVQHGGSFPVFRAMQPQQRGYGLGGMFRSLFPTVTPHLKKGLAHVGRRALTNALADMSANNTSLKDALKKQVKNEITALNPINRLKDLTSAPRKRKATLNRTPKKRRKGTRKGTRRGSITL